MKLITPRDTTNLTLVSSSIAEDDYEQWQSAFSYDRGDFVISLSTHTVYRSLTDANSGNDPDIEQAALADPLIDDPDPINWQVIGATNRWRMFDKKPSVQATAPDQIQVVLEPGRIIGGLAGFNIDANTVTIDVQSPGLARRNLLSETDTLATQSVTVEAVEHTLSFSGTGTITLSGVSTAGPLVGTGTGQRVSLVFTPTAGSLTLTVSGTVSDAQLEEGPLTDYQAVDDSLRRNLATWTQALDNAAWTKTRLGVTPNVTTAPDGTVTGSRLVPTTEDNTHEVTRAFSDITADSQVCVTVFVKPEDFTGLEVSVLSSQGWDANRTVEFGCVSGGVIANEGVETFVVPPVITLRNDGWYRCQAFFTASSATENRTIRVRVLDEATPTESVTGYVNTFAGDGVGGILFGGIQVEIGNGTSYQRIDADASQLYDQTVYSNTIFMQDETVVVDWYSYYFAPLTPLSEFVITDYPLYGDSQLTITFDQLGSTVGVGQIVLGDLRQFGTTLVNNSGFTGLDFSLVQQDEFGDLTTVRRAATRISEFEVFFDNFTLLGFDTVMRGLRGGVAAVWVGDEDARKAAINYGFYRDYRTVYRTSEFSIVSLQIQGIV